MSPVRPPARVARTARRLLLVGALIVAVGVAWPLGATTASAQSEDPQSTPRTIDVVGTGVVRGTPDVLELLLGIEVRAKGASDALARNSELLRQVLDVLRDAGVTDDDIQTAALSIWPMTNDDGTEVIGYSVSNTVQVTLRDLDRAGAVIDEAANVANDEIVVRGLSFSFDDNSRLVAKARAEAVRQARAQAEQLADAADVAIGRLLSMDETSAPAGPILRAGDSDVAEASAPIEPGTERLSVEVRLRFEIV
ncbi:MAG: SIMPL domain-containing protein [Acidimicrobiia bacterium]